MTAEPSLLRIRKTPYGPLSNLPPMPPTPDDEPAPPRRRFEPSRAGQAPRPGRVRARCHHGPLQPPPVLVGRFDRLAPGSRDVRARDLPPGVPRRREPAPLPRVVVPAAVRRDDGHHGPGSEELPHLRRQLGVDRERGRSGPVGAQTVARRGPLRILDLSRSAGARPRERQAARSRPQRVPLRPRLLDRVRRRVPGTPERRAGSSTRCAPTASGGASRRVGRASRSRGRPSSTNFCRTSLFQPPR